MFDQIRCYSTRLPEAAQRIPVKKNIPWTCTQRSSDMVEAISRVDAVLQMSMSALIQDIKSFLHAFRSKKENARAEEML